MTAGGLVACDLDGVVWVGEQPVAGAAHAVDRLRGAGARLLFLTNNSSLPVGDVVRRLGTAGIDASADEVLTSAVAATAVLQRDLPARARVLACAGAGVRDLLAERGFTVVDEWPCEAVVVGWHREFDFDRLDRSSAAARRGARLLATNTDPTYPTPDGLIPGNGALVAAVATAAGVEPEIAGKPHGPTVELVRERAGAAPGVVVGDRRTTDGALASALGWPFVLVHSEASDSGGEAQADAAVEAQGPTLGAVTDEVLALLDRPLPGAFTDP